MGELECLGATEIGFDWLRAAKDVGKGLQGVAEQESGGSQQQALAQLQAQQAQAAQESASSTRTIVAVIGGILALVLFAVVMHKK